MEKTYIIDGQKEPEFIMVPWGKLNERGVRMRRKSIKFRTNRMGKGEFTTSDVSEQEFLEDHDLHKIGRMTVIIKTHTAEPETPVTEATIPVADVAEEVDTPAKRRYKRHNKAHTGVRTSESA